MKIHWKKNAHLYRARLRAFGHGAPRLSLTTNRSHYNFGIEPWDRGGPPVGCAHLVLRPRIGTLANQSANATMQPNVRVFGDLWSNTLRRAWVEGAKMPRDREFRGSELWKIWCRLIMSGLRRAECIRGSEARRAR
jgi:hypothetical protein